MKLIYVAVVTIFFTIFRTSFVSSDEAVNLQMVRNMEESRAFIVRPSYDPGGHEDWAKDSLGHIQMTPFFHWVNLGVYKLLPLSLIQSSYLLNILFFLLTLWVFRQQVPIEKRNTFTSIYSLAVIPLHYLLLIEHEAFLTLFGFISIHFSCEGLKKRKLKYFSLAGLFLGFSFLSKLWLVAGFGLGLLAILINEIWKKKDIYFLVKASFITLLFFCISSSLHLVVTKIYSPQDFNLWVDHVYLGVFGGVGDHKDKINTTTFYTQPFYYYFFTLIRDLIYFLPVVLSVVLHAKKDIGRILKNNFLLGCVGVFSSVFLLSKVNSKDALYILPAYLSLVFIFSAFFINLSLTKKQLWQTIIISLVLLGLWSLVPFLGRTIKSMDVGYLKMVYLLFAVVALIIFIFKTRVSALEKYGYILIVFPLIFTQLQQRKDFDDIIDFINNINVKRPARETIAIADAYSHIGFKIWNRVLKYNWALKSQTLKEVLINKQFHYFIVTENTERIDEIREISNEIGLKYKKFKSSELYYRK